MVNVKLPSLAVAMMAEEREGRGPSGPAPMAVAHTLRSWATTPQSLSSVVCVAVTDRKGVPTTRAMEVHMERAHFDVRRLDRHRLPAHPTRPQRARLSRPP